MLVGLRLGQYGCYKIPELYVYNNPTTRFSVIKCCSQIVFFCVKDMPDGFSLVSISPARLHLQLQKFSMAIRL